MTAQLHSDIRSAVQEAEALSAQTGWEHIIVPTTGGFVVRTSARSIFACGGSDPWATDVTDVPHTVRKEAI